jgi:hypothetical protein
MKQRYLNILMIAALLAAGLYAAMPVKTAYAAVLYWDGGAGTTNWNDAANWYPTDTVPANIDDVILDNSQYSGNYTVNLPGGAVTVDVNSLTITPTSPNTIRLVLPNTNTQPNPSGGFRVGFTTTGTQLLTINSGGIFQNSSTAGAGNQGVVVERLRINNGGRFIHNVLSNMGSAGIVNVLDNTVPTNTSAGVFEYDISGATYGGVTTSVNYGTVWFSGSSGAVAYTVSGAGANVGIEGSMVINPNASLTVSNTGYFRIRGDLTNNGGALTFPGTLNGVLFDGSVTQTISGSGAITFNEPATIGATSTVVLGRNITAGATMTVNGTLNTGAYTLSGAGGFTLASGATLGLGDAAGISASGATGNIQVSGTRDFNIGANYTYNGAAAQISGDGLPATVNNLTVNNAAGVALTSGVTVNGTLALTSGDLTTGANTLTLAGTTCTGAADVVGNVARTSIVHSTAYCFGNPFNTVTFANTGTLPTAVTVTMQKSAPSGYAGAVTRNYVITPTGGSGFSATLRLHYLDGELNSNAEGSLRLLRYNGSSWVAEPNADTTRDATNNWVQAVNVTDFSPWAIASSGPTQVTLSGFSAAAGASWLGLLAVVGLFGAIGLVWTLRRKRA